MTAKEFFDWQTSSGTDDVRKLVAALEKLFEDRAVNI
jgi:hypothetical protein